METEKIAVRCDNEEKWSKTVCFIRKLSTPNYSYKEVLKTYSCESLCVNLKDGCYGNASWYEKEGYKIISFQEFEQTYLSPREPEVSQYWIRHLGGEQFLNKYTEPIRKDDQKNHTIIGYICLSGSGYYSSGGNTGYYSNSTQILPTKEEIKWLECCIAANKFISKEEALKPSTPKFEVGKWYKYQHWYIKYFTHTGQIWRSSEEITPSGLYRKCISNFGDNTGKELLTDLSEIQQFLPEGHPDKLPVKQEKPMETKEEDWCVILDKDNKQYIQEWVNKIKPGNYSFSVGCRYGMREGKFCCDIGTTYKDWKSISTEEFLKKIGKDVPKKEESLVGRWLKALIDSPQCINGMKKGEYLKIIDDFNGEWDRWSKWGWDKQSIGKAWELMPIGFTPPVEEKKEEKWTPKVGDWVVMIEDYSDLKKGQLYKILNDQLGTGTFWVLDHIGVTSFLAPRFKQFRKATPEEIASVTGKKESIVPEYVEIQEGYFVEKDQIGKIYKTSESFPTHLQACESKTWKAEFEGGRGKWFKPSTKEAYEAQFQTKSSTSMVKFKIGDKVKVCKREEDINGWGYLNPSSNIQKVDGVANMEFNIKSTKVHQGRNYYQHPHGWYICEDCLSLIYATPTLSKEEELLAEAKRRYPIGTKVASIYSKDYIDIVVNQGHIHYPNGGWSKDDKRIWYTGNTYGLIIYQDGKWAEIIEPVKETSSSKFQIGRWYKNDVESPGYYGKLTGSYDGTTFNSSEYIRLEFSRYSNEGTYFVWNKEHIKEVALSEIQKYLPEGHPDKFPIGKPVIFGTGGNIPDPKYDTIFDPYEVTISVTDLFKPKKSVRMSYLAENSQISRTISKINKQKSIQI